MRGAERARRAVRVTRGRVRRAAETIQADRLAEGLVPQPHENFRYRHFLMPQYLDYVSRVSWADHAVSLETAACLLQMCETRRPARVLDTGSGFSSYVLRRYAQQSGANVVSVETDDGWRAKTADYLEQAGVGTTGLMSWTEFRDGSHDRFGLVFHDLAGGALREQTMQLVTDLVTSDGLLVFDDMHDDGYRAEARRVTAAAGRRYVSMARVTFDPIGRYAGLSMPYALTA